MDVDVDVGVGEVLQEAEHPPRANVRRCITWVYTPYPAGT